MIEEVRGRNRKEGREEGSGRRGRKDNEYDKGRMRKEGE